jgi:hypothetical protein
VIPASQNDCPIPGVFYSKMYVRQTFWDLKVRGVGQSFWDGGSSIFVCMVTFMRGNTTCAEVEQNLTSIMCEFEMPNTFFDRFLVPCSVNIHVIEGSIKCDLKNSKYALVRISFYLE